MKSNRREFLKKTLYGGLALGETSVTGSYAGAVQSLNSGTGTNEMPAMSADAPPQKGKSVMGLRCKPLSEVRIAVIGLGRGGGAVGRLSQYEHPLSRYIGEKAKASAVTAGWITSWTAVRPGCL